MSFLVTCPNCGPRSVYEFRWGGEARPRPEPGASTAEWRRYVHTRRNTWMRENEWWFHSGGCQQWFQAERDISLNAVLVAPSPPTADAG
jgi:sarcosine oxidase subunit delta